MHLTITLTVSGAVYRIKLPEGTGKPSLAFREGVGLCGSFPLGFLQDGYLLLTTRCWVLAPQPALGGGRRFVYRA